MNMRMFVAAIWLACAAAATANDSAPRAVGSGSLLLRMQDGYRVATLLDTGVEMDISGLVARVAVRQSFDNTGADWAEGVYVFPLPDTAAVDRMRLHIGERIIEGEIREKEQARQDYEQAKREGRRASLVEQERPNLFIASVANIAPGERVVVEIEYLQDIRYDGGIFSLRFPLTLTPRYMPGTPLPDRQGSGWSDDTTEVPDASRISPPMAAASQSHTVEIGIDLDAGVPLETITSRYHAVNVSERQGRYRVELASPDVPMDHDFELVWRPAASDAPRAMAFTETIDGTPYYLLMVMPPSPGAATVIAAPREMIFIIDTSGSMHGTSIEQAKQALTRALGTLTGGDRFNVIAFSDRPRPLFPGSVAAGFRELAQARQFVDGLAANGGTEMRPALELALSSPPDESRLRQIVFITDGAVGNEEALYELIGKRLGSGRLFTVGIGSAPNGWFMKKAAEAGRGSFTTISALNEVGEKMDRLFEKIGAPQVTNIAIDWPGGVVADVYPPVVPDLYADEPVTLRAKVHGPVVTSAQVTVRGDTVRGAWQRELPLSAGVDHAGIGALWARARIEALADEGRRGRKGEDVRAAIVATALEHHLVSRHTSLVAVDRTPARPAGAAARSDQVPNLMPWGQSMNAIFGLPATATPAPLGRLLGMLIILAALVLMASGRSRAFGRGPAR